jgi:hypothetical protein
MRAVGKSSWGVFGFKSLFFNLFDTKKRKKHPRNLNNLDSNHLRWQENQVGVFLSLKVFFFNLFYTKKKNKETP